MDGTHKELKEDISKIKDWWTTQLMLMYWILNTVEFSSCSIVAYMKNAKDMQDDINERFSVMNEPRIQQLKSELT